MLKARKTFSYEVLMENKMDKETLEEAFLAGWQARDRLFKSANKRWDEKRDEALDEFSKNKQLHIS